jgi:hypothetical protein
VASEPIIPPAWRRQIVLAWIGSFVIFAAFPIFRLTGPERTLPCCTDHSAHWGSAILMAFDGMDVYRRPIQELCGAPTPEQKAGNPLANCVVPAQPSIAPFLINWQQYPRVYPPGAMILAAPAAFLFAKSLVRFDQANLIMVILVLAGAHLASLATFLCLWRPGSSSVTGWSAVVFCLVMPLVHLQLVDGALRGLYDPIPIFGVVAGALLASMGRPVAALLFVSLAMFTHFRALWFVPLLVAILMSVWRHRREWRASPRAWAAIGISAVLLAISAGCFALLQPALHSFHLTNPVGLKAFRTDPGLILSAGVPVAGIAGVLLWNRSWLTLAVVLWQLFVLVQTREVQQWHALFVLPMVGIAALERRASQAAVIATVLLFLWESRVAFSGWPFNGDMLADLLRS